MAPCSKSMCETKIWADMPKELLSLILDRLVLLPDYVRFGAVCKSWQLVSRDQQPARSKSCHRQPPMLFIPAGAGGTYEGRLYSICEQKLYHHRHQIPFLKRCCGSSHGWWVLPEKESLTSLSITLLNTFSGKRICLPAIPKTRDRRNHLYNNPEYIVHNVILSCDPCLYPEDWIAVAIHGMFKKLAFIRAGESSWTYRSDVFSPVKDACFHQGPLYVINSRDELVSIDLSRVQSDGTTTKMDTFVRYSIPVLDNSTRKYLVELDHDLLLVRWIFPEVGGLLDYETAVGFKVHKLCRKQP